MDFGEVSNNGFPDVVCLFDREVKDKPSDYTTRKSAMVPANDGTSTERPVILLSYKLSYTMQMALWAYREFESQKYIVDQLERQKLDLEQHYEELRSDTTLSEMPNRMELAERKLSQLADEIAQQSQLARATARKMHKHQWDMMYLLEPVFVNCYLVTRPPEMFLGRSFGEVEFLTYPNVSADSSDSSNEGGSASRRSERESASKELGELQRESNDATIRDHLQRAIPVEVESIPLPPTSATMASNESASWWGMRKRVDRHQGDQKEEATGYVIQEGHRKKGWLHGGAVVAGAVAVRMLICLYILASLDAYDEARLYHSP